MPLFLCEQSVINFGNEKKPIGFYKISHVDSRDKYSEKINAHYLKTLRTGYFYQTTEAFDC